MENLLELLKKYNLMQQSQADGNNFGVSDPFRFNQEPQSEDMNVGVSNTLGMLSNNNQDNQSILNEGNKTNKTLSLMGLLGSPEALTGLSLISAGSRGENIAQAALPSFVEGLKISSVVKSMEAQTRKEKAIKDIASKVPEAYKGFFEAFPETAFKVLYDKEKNSLSNEALKVYAKKLRGDQLSTTEQELYDAKVKGGENPLNAFFAKILADPKMLKEFQQK